jgi:hypothetical protein
MYCLKYSGVWTKVADIHSDILKLLVTSLIHWISAEMVAIQSRLELVDYQSPFHPVPSTSTIITDQSVSLAEEAATFLQSVADIKYSIAVSEQGVSSYYQEVFEVDSVYDVAGSSFMPHSEATSATSFILSGDSRALLPQQHSTLGTNEEKSVIPVKDENHAKAIKMQRLKYFPMVRLYQTLSSAILVLRYLDMLDCADQPESNTALIALKKALVSFRNLFQFTVDHMEKERSVRIATLPPATTIASPKITPSKAVTKQPVK